MSRAIRSTGPLAGLASCFLALAPAYAQSTSGVFGPSVEAGTQEAAYRVSYRPQGDGARNQLVQRLQYQRAVSGALRWRLVGEVSGAVSDQDLDELRGEFLWDLGSDGARWRSGLRLDVRLREGNAPEELTFNYSQEVVLSEAWTARAVVRAAREFGDRGRDGLLLETRARLFTERAGRTFGIEGFNAHGSTATFDPFGGRQQVGAFAIWPAGEGWSLFTGVLVGANRASPDADYRLFVARSF